MNAEHQQLEWKAAWQDEHLKWVCAFANSEGGTLVIGRNDEGYGPSAGADSGVRQPLGPLEPGRAA